MKKNCVLLAAAAVWLAMASGGVSQTLGKSDPSFSQPSRAPGVDYVLPTESEIKATLDRIRDHFVRSTPYHIIDTQTGAVITDLSKPTKTAGIDMRGGQFNDWDYPMGVVLAAMLQVSDVTGDASYCAYTFKNFDFIFDHEDYFRKQAELFGAQSHGLRRLLEFRELDDCGAIGAALIKANRQKPVSLWADDLYMSVPFLSQMGVESGDRAYFDDAARQVIQVSARLQDPATGLWDHSWFENTAPDPKFYWGRGAGWSIMAAAELLSVMPEDHPERARVMEIFRRGAQGAGATQGGMGLWHQLLDKNDSYLETSGSAMFTFAIARGVNRGWLSPAYAPVAQAG